MAKNTLPVDFKDDIMNSSMGGKRRYRMINNSDGTISLEDVTKYDQVGSNFGASQMNATNEAVNAAADAGKIIDDIDAINNVTQEGYIAGARALKQVNNSLVAKPVLLATITSTNTSNEQTLTDNINNYRFLLFIRTTNTSNTVNGTSFCPIDLFKSMTKVVTEYYSPSANSNRGLHVFYKTDTTIKCYVTQDIETGYIYGIK